MIALYAEADIFGGVQVLIVRFSYYLAANNIPFVLIARKGTRISEELRWARQIDPEDLEHSDIKIDYAFFPHVCTLKQKIFWGKFRKSAVLCWLVHPTEIFSSFFPAVNTLLETFGYQASWWVKKLLRSHNRRVSSLLSSLVSGGGLIVMDGATRRGLKYFFPEVYGECKLIPIPSPAEMIVKSHRIPSAKLSIGYLGRIDQFKASALTPFIKYNLAELSSTYDIEMHLVAEGNCLDSIVQLCQVKNIVVHCYGFLPNEDARRVIRENTDVAVCMGTAALDIAAIGHPCIIIDPSLKRTKVPQEKFRFVDELDEFTLGEFRDFVGYKQGIHSLAEVVDMVRNDKAVGARGSDYVAKHHNPDLIFSSLIDAMAKSAVYGRDLEDISGQINQSYEALDRGVRSIVPTNLLSLLRRAMG